MSREPRASFYSLGCKVNQAESRATAEELQGLGYRIVPFGAPADVCIVNTCSVTDQADVKSRSILRRASRSGADPLVVATGCYADVAPERVAAIPGVAEVVRNADKPRLAEIVHETLLRSGRLLFPLPGEAAPELPAGELLALQSDVAGSDRTRAVLKIQDGCNHFCSFCIIPFARGRLRSRDPEAVLAEARRRVEQGFGEIVLTGICLGDYGDERGARRGERDPLASLLECLAAIPGLQRIRLSSLDPADVSPDLVDTLAGLPSACRHLHLSLQSGDEEVLRRMRRRYSAAQFEDLATQLQDRIPDLALTADVIVGFPGETEAQFAATRALCERVGFMRLHVFPYSPRSGTLAARWADDVPRSTKESRTRELIALSRRQGLDFGRRFVGRTVDVLVEGLHGASGLRTGLTDNYLRVDFAGEEGLRGQLVPVVVLEAGEERAGGVLAPGKR